MTSGDAVSAASDPTGWPASSSVPAIISDPELGSLRRIGIVDVGSNSVRMVVFDGAARSPAYFFNEKVFCGLGSSLAVTGCLNPDGRRKALAAIRRFTLLAGDMGLTSLVGVGTAAIRDSTDGEEFCRELQEATGLEVAIASGEEEARLAAQGVLLGWPDADGLVCDIGGYSAEFAELRCRQIGHCTTLALGPLAIERVCKREEDRRAHVAGLIGQARRQFDRDCPALYLVGGSWRVIARLHMEHCEYPLRVLNEYRMPRDSLDSTMAWIRKSGIDRIRSRYRLPAERARALPSAMIVLEEILAAFEPAEIAVSGYGIREGLLYGLMPTHLRDRDPLIEACLHSEISSSRRPGLGETLFRLVRPLFKTAGHDRLRLIHAACLLHDVTWRAHPDYRAEISFDNATRANLGGLDHAGRVFLALALFHRYRNSGDEHFITNYRGLLPEHDLRQAKILGKAMRFGAMIAVISPEKIARLKFKPGKHRLTLTLPPALQEIYGEAAATRFESLASAMDCEARVEIV